MVLRLYGRLPRIGAALCILGMGALLHSGSAVGAPERMSVLRSTVNHTLARAGGGTGALLYDLSARRLLLALRADTRRPPASVEKLYTSTALLERFGPQRRLDTTVSGVGSLGSDGVWRGSLYLRGGGDPTFGDVGFARATYGDGQEATVSALASVLAARGITAVQGAVLGDESLFDTLRGGPTTNFAPDRELAGALGALAFDRGSSGPEHGPHAPAAYAAARLVSALRRRGIQVSGGSGVGLAPSSATPIGRVQSPPLAELLRLMDTPSDNYLAETLLKDLGAYFGGAGTTPAGAAVVLGTMRALGIDPAVVDGSGLSRADATSPRQVVTVLNALSATPLGPVLRGALAVAGRTGTLARRLRGTAAAGRCQAKTGTLDFVSNVAGWCTALGGHTVVFALLMDGLGEATAHSLQDRVLTALAAYDDRPPGAPTQAPPGGPTVSRGPSGPTGPSSSRAGPSARAAVARRRLASTG